MKSRNMEDQPHTSITLHSWSKILKAQKYPQRSPCTLHSLFVKEALIQQFVNKELQSLDRENA